MLKNIQDIFEQKEQWGWLISRWQNLQNCLAGVAQLVGAAAGALKGRGFDSWSGHVPGLQVQSLVGAHQPMFLSLSFSLSGINIYMKLKNLQNHSSENIVILAQKYNIDQWSKK